MTTHASTVTRQSLRPGAGSNRKNAWYCGANSLANPAMSNSIATRKQQSPAMIATGAHEKPSQPRFAQIKV